ncbi:hypothetical protein Ccrd_026007 [Cynara cardunculus var. scolymus]|uniref:Uncharacterized protein n=1 Tax=Cynara cardunculus var. scolymus TaxID=59895 RepID=A0A103T1T5_CYNCS|nr:hypothetical protein Ccrd_026007 [Cynara cardunculus var. scolymus]
MKHHRQHIRNKGLHLMQLAAMFSRFNERLEEALWLEGSADWYEACVPFFLLVDMTTHMLVIDTGTAPIFIGWWIIWHLKVWQKLRFLVFRLLQCTWYLVRALSTHNAEKDAEKCKIIDGMIAIFRVLVEGGDRLK